ncbi:MAG: cold-shock protein [Flavobacteriales bacterium]
MPTGTVKFYNRKNKFGFIKVDDTGAEIYVRQSGVVDPINEGDRVEFEMEEHPKGPIAVKVKKLAAE